MALNEADTRAKLVDPAIHARGWTEELIKREVTAGAIDVIDGRPRRRRSGRADYLLRVRATTPAQPVAVALIEAKAENLPPTHGLEQVKLYARCRLLNVPFVFSTNGHLFVEFDRSTAQTGSPKPLSEFPSPTELRARYEQAMGFSLDDPAARPLLVPYPGGETSRRYYQDAAIRAVLEKIARGEKRALLALATGSGKTFIAVHLLKKIADAGQLRRALFVCDRDELRSQALTAFQNVFGTDSAPVSSRDPAKNARIVVATYQTLDVATEDMDANFLKENYPENYFSHIIIDECHRSAWGKWSEVLRRNPDAVQIGLTATPRKLTFAENTDEAKTDAQISADNIRHFGDPVYEYELAQGIEDGYLAACEILKGRVNVDETGITIDQVLARKPINANTGQPVTRDELRHLYEKTSYEDRILLPDRVIAMCADLYSYLLETGGPEQKTIIFCVRDRHADDVAAEMNRLYARWCTEQGSKPVEPYAFKCTASVDGANRFLPDLRGDSRSHFVAATVDLLTTGVDVPAVRNIVFFKYVRSPIAMHQMLGRGTRIHIETDKLLFRVYDYTNATRLFNEEFLTRFSRRKPSRPEQPAEREAETIIQVEGFDVHVSEAGRFIVTQVDGKATPVTVEDYKERLAARLVEEAPTIEAFRSRWIAPEERRMLLSRLPEDGRSASIIRKLEEMEAYDLYDVLAELGYGLDPRTRAARAAAFAYKPQAWLGGLPAETASALRAIAGQFAHEGTEALESPHIFDIPEVARTGGLDALRSLGKPAEILHEAKERIFAA